MHGCMEVWKPTPVALTNVCHARLLLHDHAIHIYKEVGRHVNPNPFSAP